MRGAGSKSWISRGIRMKTYFWSLGSSGISAEVTLSCGDGCRLKMLFTVIRTTEISAAEFHACMDAMVGGLNDRAGRSEDDLGERKG